MYIFGKLHPDLPEANEPGYAGGWLGERDMHDVIDSFYTKGYTIPLSLDHRNMSTQGYIPRDNVIGEVVDLFKDRNGDLMAKTRLSAKHAAYDEVNRGIAGRGEKWGLSVGVLPGATGGSTKELMHVALTPDPGFGHMDTYIKGWHLNEDRANAMIARDLYTPGEGGRAYASQAFDEKLKRSLSSHIVKIMSESVQQQQQQQQQATPPAEVTPTEKMDVVTSQAVPFTTVKFETRRDLSDVDEIDHELARMNEHITRCLSQGITYPQIIQENPQFNEEMTTYIKQKAEKEKEDDEYTEHMLRTTKNPKKLLNWTNILMSRKPEHQLAAQEAKVVHAANATLFFQEKKRNSEIVAQLVAEKEVEVGHKRRLEEENKSLKESFAQRDGETEFKRHRIMPKGDIEREKARQHQASLPLDQQQEGLSLVNALGKVHGTTTLRTHLQLQSNDERAKNIEVQRDFKATQASRSLQDVLGQIQDGFNSNYYS